MKFKEFLAEEHQDKVIEDWFYDTAESVISETTGEIWNVKQDGKRTDWVSLNENIDVKFENGKIVLPGINGIFLNKAGDVSAWPLNSNDWPKLHELIIEKGLVSDWNKMPNHLEKLYVYNHTKITDYRFNVPALTDLKLIGFNDSVVVERPLALTKLPSLEKIILISSVSEPDHWRALKIVADKLREEADLTDMIEALHDAGLEQYAKL